MESFKKIVKKKAETIGEQKGKYIININMVDSNLSISITLLVSYKSKHYK